MARSGGASTPLPLRRRLTGPGHPPQPMSASRGGPWTQSLRLLRLLASAVGNQNRDATAQVDRAPRPAPTGDAPLPRRAPHCSARDRGELQPRAPPRTRSPPPPPPPQHPWGTGDFKGVWGFGSREITGTERRLSLPWERFLLRVDAAPGRGQGGVSAESGPSYTIRTHTAHVHGAASPSLPCLFVRLF